MGGGDLGSTPVPQVLFLLLRPCKLTIARKRAVHRASDDRHVASAPSGVPRAHHATLGRQVYQLTRTVWIPQLSLFLPTMFRSCALDIQTRPLQNLSLQRNATQMQRSGS